MGKYQMNTHDLLLCLSSAVDLVSPRLNDHHQQVAYLSSQIAEHIGLSLSRKRDILYAGAMHDIGALSLKERLELIDREPAATIHQHGFRGAKLLEDYEPLKKAAKIIKYHHLPWNNGEGKKLNGESVPLESHIIHIADRTCTLINKDEDVIAQLPAIQEKILGQRNTAFMPKLTDALADLFSKEYIWLDLTYPSPFDRMLGAPIFHVVEYDLDQVINLTKIISRLIDFRSPFTANHSSGVAAVARKIAELIGFSDNECKMMFIAGNLHDLGKLAIDNAILEKPGKLTEEEFTSIRSHTFLTYRLLEVIDGFEVINQWASYHHEKLDGSGYPFHLTADRIPLGSRVMAVADIFTSLAEDRPYRAGMNDGEIKELLSSLVEAGQICGNVVSILMENYDMIKEECRQAQKISAIEYEKLMNEMD